jgi:hypothetical protein
LDTEKQDITMEKAAILEKRFERDTARGVRCLIKRRGKTGYGAQQLSTKTKATIDNALAMKSV